MNQEVIQINADNIRLLKVGLRTHDPETTIIAFERIAAVSDKIIATEVVTRTITDLMTTENWRFSDGQFVSPLL